MAKRNEIDVPATLESILCTAELNRRPSRPPHYVDGLEAVETAAKVHPDVVLLDIGLPKLRLRDGPQDTGKAVAEEHCAGRADRLGSARGPARPKDAGFDHHFIKPVSQVALTKVLAENGSDRQSRLVDR